MRSCRTPRSRAASPAWRWPSDPGLKKYPGGVPLNTYHFFGRHAISVGSSKVPEGGEMVTRFDEASGRYLKAIFSADNRLTGIYGVNEFFDGGVMCQLILRRIDLSPVKERFLANPLAVGRELMSKTVEISMGMFGGAYNTIAFDANKCDGCGDCMTACATAKTGTVDNRARASRSSAARLAAFELALCRQCADPKCVTVCPAAALTKNYATA
jgi:ferredoxin